MLGESLDRGSSKLATYGPLCLPNFTLFVPFNKPNSIKALLNMSISEHFYKWHPPILILKWNN